MTVRELARYLDCHPSTIYRFLGKREIPAFRLGGAWRFSQDAIDEWIKGLTKAAPPKRSTDNDKGARPGKGRRRRRGR